MFIHDVCRLFFPTKTYHYDCKRVVPGVIIGIEEDEVSARHQAHPLLSTLSMSQLVTAENAVWMASPDARSSASDHFLWNYVHLHSFLKSTMRRAVACNGFWKKVFYILFVFRFRDTNRYICVSSQREGHEDLSTTLRH